MLSKKKVATLVALLSVSVSAFAGKVEVSQLIDDQYIGAGNSNDSVGNPANKYDIYSMQVTRTTDDNSRTFLEVAINTNFQVGGDWGNGNIHYGDLFIAEKDHYDPDGSNTANNGATDKTFSPNSNGLNSPDYYREGDLGSDTRWDYGFDISNNNSNAGGAGTLYDIKHKQDGQSWHDRAYANSLKTAKEYNDQYDGRANQVVALYSPNSGQTSNGGNYLDNVGNGSWTTNNNGFGGANRQVVFNFEITGIDALVNAQQLAFRWAMTCANDIIEGVASFKSPTLPTPVPAPTTLALMALALGGLAFRNKNAKV